MTRQIPWLRVVAESLAIVASILLAFGIQAWWESYQDRSEALEMLGGLEEEFAREAEQLGAMATNYEWMRTQLEWLLGSAVEADDPIRQRVDSALVGLVWPTTYDPGSGARDALLASGRLELLRSEPLRALLAGWQAVLDETRDNEEAMREFVLGVSVPFLAARGIPTGRPVASWPVPAGSRFPPPALSESRGDDAEMERRYHELIRDPEFMSIAEYRYVWAALSALEFQSARTSALEVLDLIRRESGTARSIGDAF